MTKLKAAVIGCGSVARIGHVRWYKKNRDVTLVALCSKRAKAAKWLADLYDVPRVYTDMYEMLEKEKPDLVSVTTSIPYHHDPTVAALKSGANVLVEKPMAVTLEECDDMIRTASKRNLKLVVGFNKRQQQGLRKVKELIDSGKVGSPVYAFVHFDVGPPRVAPEPPIGPSSAPPSPASSHRPVWKVLWSCGGGILTEQCHYIDVFRWILASDVVRVSAEMSMKVAGEKERFENFCVTNLTFKNGTIGTIEVSALGPTYQYGQIEKGGVYGSKGHIMFRIPDWLENTPPEVLYQDASLGTWTQLPLKADNLDFATNNFCREIDNFVKIVKEDIKPYNPNGMDGRASQEVVLASYLSWYTGKSTRLPLSRTPALRRIFTRLKKETRESLSM